MRQRKRDRLQPQGLRPEFARVAKQDPAPEEELPADQIEKFNRSKISTLFRRRYYPLIGRSELKSLFKKIRVRTSIPPSLKDIGL